MDLVTRQLTVELPNGTYILERPVRSKRVYSQRHTSARIRAWGAVVSSLVPLWA